MSRHSIAQTGLDEKALAALVEGSIEGDGEVWAELWLLLAPLVEAVARRAAITGRLSRREDERRDIVVRLMGALRADGFRRLAELGERLAQRDGSFRPWLFKLAHDAAIDHVRGHPEHLGRKARAWARALPFRDVLPDDEPPPSRVTEARRMLACAEGLLDPLQRDALHLWLLDDDFVDIATALGLGGGAEAAARLVRSAVERLRYRFVVRGACVVRAPGKIDRCV
jgi:DNA-directed RNA polymerase specialized sigma24 family protein